MIRAVYCGANSCTNTCNRMIKRLPLAIISVLLLGGYHHPALAAAQAQLDRTTISQDESVWLLIEVATDQRLDTPDISQITPDFEILDSRRSNPETVRQQHRMQWRFELMPRRAGVLILPAFTIGQHYRTEPLSVQVLPAETPEPDVFILTDIEPSDPYVMAQVHYRERIFAGPRLHDVSISRSAPFTDALVHPLGDFQPYVAERDGQHYRVFERRYAIIPQRSGPIPLPPLSLRGRVRTAAGAETGQRGRRIERHGEPVTLQVRPRPASASDAAWLPSVAVTLEETWPNDPPQFQVGTPITRNLRLSARGVEAVQLPRLHHPDLSWAQVYADAEQLATRHDESWLLGQYTQTLRIVPHQAGQFMLPAVTVHWWDTEADGPQIAQLPARSVIVQAADTLTDNYMIPPLPAPITLIQPPDSPSYPPWPLLSSGLLLLWLLTLLGWWHERRRHSVPAAPATPPAHTAPPAPKLRRACRDNDPCGAAQALLSWGQRHWPETPPANLIQLAERLPKIRNTITELDRYRYGPPQSTWDGSLLWRAWRSQ